MQHNVSYLPQTGKCSIFLHLRLVLLNDYALQSEASGARRRRSSASALPPLWSATTTTSDLQTHMGFWCGFGYWEIVNKLQNVSQTCAKAVLCFHGNMIDSWALLPIINCTGGAEKEPSEVLLTCAGTARAPETIKSFLGGWGGRGGWVGQLFLIN